MVEQTFTDQYIAGVVDSQCCFTINRSPGFNELTVREFRFHPVATISHRDNFFLEAIVASLGYGAIGLGRKVTNPKHCRMFHLGITGQNLTRFCAEIGPLLYLKRGQSELVLEARRIKERRYGRISDEDYNSEVRIYAKMAELNMKGPSRPATKPTISTKARLYGLEASHG